LPKIDKLAFLSKNLYSAANSVIRHNFVFGWGYLNYNKTYQLMKYHQAYKALPAKVSQQVLILLDKNLLFFFEAQKAYSLEPEKFRGRPKIHKYKNKNQGRNVLNYTIQAISKPLLKKRIIKLSGTKFSGTTLVSSQKICQVRIVPKCDCYVIEVIYNEPSPAHSPSLKEAVSSIDLGLNNLVALTSNLPGFIPLYHVRQHRCCWAQRFIYIRLARQKYLG
jgi:putative transposase